MKNPNGYGTVYKMHGRRRRPYIAAVTITTDGKRTRKALGYYATQQEALSALAEYNNQPYDLTTRGVTVQEFFNKWLAYRDKRDRGHEATKQYRITFNKHCKSVFDNQFIAIQSIHIQRLVDNAPTPVIAQRIKSTWLLLYKYAALTGITTSNPAQIVELPHREKSTMHKPFTSNEIKELWQHKTNTIAQYALIYCYTGLRPSEFLNIKRENVNLNERYMKGGMKTLAGRDRTIPIAKKILPFIKAMYNKKEEYLSHEIRTYSMLRARWNECPIKAIQNHLPHDGRHTCESALDNAGVNKRIIQLIIGHAGRDVDENVYTHKTISQLVEAIDKIMY
jgi:integrase